MNRKIGKRLTAVAVFVIALATLGQTVHAQEYSLYTTPDRASYVPGDSGTLTIVISNTGTDVIQLNNLTVYFPWAGFGPDGKWQGNQSATYSNQFIGVSGGTSSSTFTTTFQFTIPSWFGGASASCGGGGPSPPRYGQYASCVVVGSNASTSYQLRGFTDKINMAAATYTPTSILANWLPIATLVVLAIATVLLALVWTSNRKLAKK